MHSRRCLTLDLSFHLVRSPPTPVLRRPLSLRAIYTAGILYAPRDPGFPSSCSGRAYTPCCTNSLCPSVCHDCDRCERGLSSVAAGGSGICGGGDGDAQFTFAPKTFAPKNLNFEMRPRELPARKPSKRPNQQNGAAADLKHPHV